VQDGPVPDLRRAPPSGLPPGLAPQSWGSAARTHRLPLRIGEIFYASPGVLAAAGAVSPVAHALPRY
jgi:hypothetical protein